MLSLKLYGPNDIRLTETDIPETGDGELQPYKIGRAHV